VSRIVILALLAAPAAASDEIKSAVSTLTSPGIELDRRLAAVDRLAELQATAELLKAWADGGPAVRLAVPVGFHAIGVRALGPALTAMGAPDAKTRAAGAVCLGAIGRDARLGVRKLLAALTEKAPLVRLHAAEALGHIGAPAEDAVSGLIALAMRDETLAAVSMQAMTRIALDVQLRAARPEVPAQVAKTIRRGEAWLFRQQEEDGSWGSVPQTAFVVLALAEGGLLDEFRLPVRGALLRVVLELSRRPRPEPLVVLAAHAAWRETRDPLLRLLALRAGERMAAHEVETAEGQAWRRLALRGAMWSGDAVPAAAFAADGATEPKLLGLALAPERDAAAVKAAAERMLADKLVWTEDEQRFGPDRLARTVWSMRLAGGDAADRTRKLVFAGALQNRIEVNEMQVRWEPPPGVVSEPVPMTAGVVIALKLAAAQFPPRALPMPEDAKGKMVVAALKGCAKHPDAAVRAYAASMLTLWE